MHELGNNSKMLMDNGGKLGGCKKLKAMLIKLKS